jgi:hypothetical protein
MSIDPPPPSWQRRSGNIPANVASLPETGSVELVLLADLGPFGTGSTVNARLRPGANGLVSAQDFPFHRKKGLRPGGTVMLHRAAVAEDGVSALRVEVLRKRGDTVDGRVFPDILACILPPPSAATAMVEEAILMLSPLAVAARTISAAIGDLAMAMEEAALYGPAGLVFRGIDRHGGRHAFSVLPAEGLAPEEHVRRLLTGAPKELMRHARESNNPFEVVPLVRMPIAPDRQPRLSAQAVNHPYVLDGAWRFTRGTAALSLMGSFWTLTDATPIDLAPQLYHLDGSPA